MAYKFSSSTATAALLLLTCVQGHMVMIKPHSYNLYKIAPLVQVDPLNIPKPLGMNYPYPCQNKHDVEEVTPIKAGEVQLVQFSGAAQHGGGSCQFSISYDQPTNGWNTSATFKTIYSIIGGCPGEMGNEQDNLPNEGRPKDLAQRPNTDICHNDFGVNCTREFLIPIPDFLPSGPATFAWTWFNKVGNREMYMNCAPVNITSSTTSREKYDALPNIFIANLRQTDIPGYDGCSTGNNATSHVLNIPNPGKYGRIINVLNKPFGKPGIPNDGSKLCPNIDNDKLPTFEENPKTVHPSGGAVPTGGGVNAGASASAPASGSATGTEKPPAATTSAAAVGSGTKTQSDAFASLSGTYGAGTKTKSYSVVPISSGSVKVEGGAGGTFITAPSDGSAPSATASATGGADAGSVSGSEGGECHDPDAPTETGATAVGGDEAGVTVTRKTSLTLEVTVTSNVPPAASDAASAPASAPAAVTTGEAPDAGAGAGSDSGAGAGSDASASAPAAAPSNLGDTANDASGSGGSSSGSGSDSGSGSGATHEKKECKTGDIAICFDDEYFGICANGWAVPQKVSAGTRCEGGSLVHSAVRKGERRVDAYAPGERHARRHLKRRAGRGF
ncbi:hypothetical protein B0T20DRAFT_31830 [Sordaria brevicollis]|uniref:Lytic polysaccharide monooxygenase n=1 Tax=Sordaria brevicollis TaxID=83679 RepID=A0AAE0P8T8_SORBR|nr:hypothetical protein B0T20DRAFT_31830 [Sordaria brevicollis]